MKSPSVKADVVERLAEMERVNRRHKWDSAIVPSPWIEPATSGEIAVAVPADLLLDRFHDLEQAIATSRRDLCLHVAAARLRDRRAAWRMTGLIVATSAIVFVLARITPPQPAPIAGASPGSRPASLARSDEPKRDSVPGTPTPRPAP